MDESKQGITRLIEDLALKSLTVEPDDLPSLGLLLEGIEKIEKIAQEGELASLAALGKGIRKLIEKIILNECPDPGQGILLLGSGLKLIQGQARAEGAEETGESESFWLGWENLVGESRQAYDRQKGKATPAAAFLEQDAELYRDFISEALEHLGSIELNLINLEQSPENGEYINAIFRPFHTIKGVSGFLNLKDIQRFSHAMESLLDEARNGRLQISQLIVDFILESVDLLKNMILDLREQIETGKSAAFSFDLTPYLKRIEGLMQGDDREGEGLSQAARQGAASVPERAVPRLGEILSSQGVVSPQDLSESLKEQEGKGEARLGEILIKDNKAKPAQVLEALREQKRISSQFKETWVKVDTGKLDNLVDLIGELVIAESLVEQNPLFASLRDQKLLRDFSQLKRITTDLQKISMSLRMVPIKQTFEKMVRLVRDQAHKIGKQIKLHMSGEETEIDRNMVESLYDPLVHMVRNAIDHGLEFSEERKRAGKPQTGNIFLRAYQKGGNVVIEIEDDGRGLNREKILNKARERGLVAEETLTTYQIDQLIFEPGFSTAEKVTDISGRGVGMDVVKRTVDKLRGKNEIFSTLGQGTRFVMRVPLTLAVMDGIVVQIGGERYIIPTVFIKETLKPRKEEVYSLLQKGDLIKVRENLLPLIRLHKLLGVGNGDGNKPPWETLVIVVENEGAQKCLMVDDLIGKQEVVIKNLGNMLKEVKGVAGATIMGDGRAGLILDICGIFEIDQRIH